MAKRKTKAEREAAAAALEQYRTDLITAGRDAAALALQDVLAEITALRTAYDRLDVITDVLIKGFPDAPMTHGDSVSTADGSAFRLNDNFAESNVAFRPAGVRRFEFIPED